PLWLNLRHRRCGTLRGVKPPSARLLLQPRAASADSPASACKPRATCVASCSQAPRARRRVALRGGPQRLRLSAGGRGCEAHALTAALGELLGKVCGWVVLHGLVVLQRMVHPLGWLPVLLGPQHPWCRDGALSSLGPREGGAADAKLSRCLS